MAQDMATGRPERLAVADLRPPLPAATATTIASAPDLSQLDGRDWDEARRRLTIIKSLLEKPRRPRSEVEGAAKELNVDAATIYRWMNQYRSSGKLSSLLPYKRDGGRGRSRLKPEVEQIVKLAIENFYLTKRQPTVKATADEVARLCKAAGIDPPHLNTIRTRVYALSEETRLKRRANAKIAKDRFTARPGAYEEAQHPLSVVQIDHTEMDIIVVDAEHRMPIGRPWITLVMDVYSRMVLGMYISLETPGAHGTGLALAHAILPKETWLARRNILQEWPCWGFPARIHMDNAQEFRGEMLRRACEEYSIEINFRPIATPHFGGHIERMMGTLASALHTLPGTTFSNPRARGESDPNETAAMTLDELEAWVAEYIVGVYHKRFHTSIKSSPLKRWTDAILGDGNRLGVGMPDRPADTERISLDFTPAEERTIQTYGVRVDGVHYYSDVLRPYINSVEGKRKRQFIFRRDPRDISQLHFWHPELKQYFVIPYRDVSRPTMTVWELRAIRRQLEEQGRAEIDEDAIFATLDRLRERQDRAVTSTKTARKNRERQRTASARTADRRQPNKALPTAPGTVKIGPTFEALSNLSLDSIKPFEVEDA
jgi:putative transposase